MSASLHVRWTITQVFYNMYVPEKMRLNKFQQVYIKSNKDLFRDLGKRTSSASFTDSGANLEGDSVPVNVSKIDAMQMVSDSINNQGA